MHALSVWLVAPEFAPYVAFGGIGTGLRGFGESLLRRGHRVTVAIPVAKMGPFGAKHIADIAIQHPGLGHESTTVALSEMVESSGLRILFFEIPDIDPLGYGTDVSTDPSAARRSAMFTRAVVEWIGRTYHSQRIDIVHAHEWPAAMVPYLLREIGLNMATVFTIHSLAYQGLFPISALGWFALGPEHATMERLELYGRISLLKGGVSAARRITTVSPTYAREIQLPESGELLDGVLRARCDALSGIVNGIDTNSWNPSTDSALPAHYSAVDVSGKRICKKSFCEMHGFAADKPLLVSLGRLVEQKGIDWLVGAIPAIVDRGANVVFAGTGDSEIEKLVTETVQAFPGRTLFCGRVSDENARRLLAAADLAIMPSRWEPCGIVQLQAMRYGAIPIGRRTGGLADTIIDADEHPDVANGFLFDEPSSEGVANAVSRAIARLGSPEARAMQKRGMLAAHGWEGPVRSYERVYRAALG